MSASKEKSLRLFVAVYPPPDVARVLLGALEAIELPPHRPVAAEQVHLTLHFIGDTPPGRLDATVETVQRSAGGLSSFELTVFRLITLPPRRPRLVAAETDRPPALMELQRRLATRLALAARPRAGERFRPHLTLCRFRAPAVRPALDEPIDLEGFRVSGIELMRSTLTSERAEHQRVVSVALE